MLSKMGISTIRSYLGAQLFEVLGIGKAVVERYFTGTISRLGGIGLNEIAKESLIRHDAAFNANFAVDSPRIGRRLSMAGDGRNASFQPEHDSQFAKSVSQRRLRNFQTVQPFGQRTGKKSRYIALAVEVQKILVKHSG